MCVYLYRVPTSKRPLIVCVVNQCSAALQLVGSVTCGIVLGIERPCLSAGWAGTQGDPSQGQWASFSPDGLSRVLQDSRKKREREGGREGYRYLMENFCSFVHFLRGWECG